MRWLNEPSHLDLCCLQKPIIITCGSETERVNPFTSSGLFCHNSLDGSVSNSRVFLSLLCFIEIPVLNANSVDPNQKLHSAASDLSLHRLPVALWWVSQLKWVQEKLVIILE